MEVSATEREELITVALIPGAAADLGATIMRRHVSAVDVVNRAIALYEFLDKERAVGAEVLLRYPDETVFRLKMT